MKLRLSRQIDWVIVSNFPTIKTQPEKKPVTTTGMLPLYLSPSLHDHNYAAFVHKNSNAGSDQHPCSKFETCKQANRSAINEKYVKLI